LVELSKIFKGTKMQGLGKYLSEKQECNDVNSIQDINAQYSYEDKIGGGLAKEWDLLSCGQDSSNSGYNELQRFYDEHIPHIPSEFKGLGSKITFKVVCECCKKLSHESRTHDSFKKCVGKKLEIDVV